MIVNTNQEQRITDRMTLLFPISDPNKTNWTNGLDKNPFQKQSNILFLVNTDTFNILFRFFQGFWFYWPFVATSEARTNRLKGESFGWMVLFKYMFPQPACDPTSGKFWDPIPMVALESWFFLILRGRCEEWRMNCF